MFAPLGSPRCAARVAQVVKSTFSKPEMVILGPFLALL